MPGMVGITNLYDEMAYVTLGGIRIMAVLSMWQVSVQLGTKNVILRALQRNTVFTDW